MGKETNNCNIGDEEIDLVVNETEGFSGRAILKLAIA